MINFSVFNNRYLDNHVKGCGKKEEEIEQEQKQEQLIIGATQNLVGSNPPGTVILISNEGHQQTFMVANTGEDQTVTLSG